MVEFGETVPSAPQAELIEQASNTAASITQSLMEHVEGIAAQCHAAAIFVYADALDESLCIPQLWKRPVFCITKTLSEETERDGSGITGLRVPNVALSRMGQLKIAVFLALSRGLIKRGDIIVCLAGPPASGTLDMILVTQIGREFEIYAFGREETQLPCGVQTNVVERLVDIATELGNEGREGKPAGALFVIGDTEHVLPLTRPLILNPFRGYPESERNVLDPALKETIKELSALDGAFLIGGDGVIETCGVLLKTASQEEYELPPGLGARHHAAAGMTAVTASIAITVSESTGTVSIFRGGKIITEIERLRTTGPLRRPFS